MARLTVMIDEDQSGEVRRLVAALPRHDRIHLIPGHDRAIGESGWWSRVTAATSGGWILACGCLRCETAAGEMVLAKQPGCTCSVAMRQ